MTTQPRMMPDLDEVRSGLNSERVRETAPPAIDIHPEINPLEVLTRIVQRRTVVGKLSGAALLVGMFLCFLLPVRYTAVTRIMPPQQTQPATALLMNQLANSGAGGSLTSIAAKQLGVKNQNDIYLGLLGSRPVADGIIRRYGLQRLYRSRDMTDAREKLAGYTTISSEKNGFIALSVTDVDKHRASEMANAYTEQLRVLMKTLALTEASQRRLFYEEQLKYAKESLITGENSLERVQQKKGLIALDAQTKAMIEGLAAIHAQIAARQVELEGLRSYSTDHNPEVQLAERELSSLRQEAARVEEQNPSSGFAGLGLRDVPDAGLEYLRAEHEVKYRQAMFDLLMKQYDAARLDEAQEAAIIQVVEPAIEPDRRSSPHRLIILLLALVTGFLGGCCAALLPWAKEILLSDPERIRQLRGIQHAFSGKESGGELISCRESLR